MKINKNINNKPQDIVNRNQKVITTDNIENLNYLYPNGHRITHQMRWFKGTRDRDLKCDAAA